MQRGRKSSEDTLSPVVSLVPGTRPDPPPELTPEQAETWRTIVGRRPAGWFMPEVFPLLVQLVRHVSISKMVGEALAEVDSKTIGDHAGFQRFEKLRRMHQAEGRAITTLATKLRITLASQRDPRQGHAASHIIGPKPWETD
jgi:hypothetical protein